jgi:hypothetical protein
MEAQVRTERTARDFGFGRYAIGYTRRSSISQGATSRIETELRAKASLCGQPDYRWTGNKVRFSGRFVSRDNSSRQSRQSAILDRQHLLLRSSPSFPPRHAEDL